VGEVSIKVMSAVWDRSAATGSDRLVMLYIAERCNDDGGGAYPAVQTIADRCMLTPRSVQAAFKRLTAMGELEIQQGAGPRGTNVYKIILDGLGQMPSPGHEWGEVDNTPQRLHPRKDCTPPPAKIAPNTSVEPSVVSSKTNVLLEPPPKKSSPTTAIIDAFCRYVGIAKLANYPKAAAAAKKLAEADITPDEIPSLYEFVAGWAGAADLNMMLAQADKWRAKQHAPVGKKAKRSELPPMLQKRVDSWTNEQLACGGSILPYPAKLQVAIDDWMAANE